LLPTTVFAPPRINAPEGVSQPSLLKPAPRNGLLLTRGDCPFPDHLCGVIVPGLFLQRHAKAVADPFGCELRSSPRFPGLGNFNVHNPLPAPFSALPTVLRASAPLRDSRPSGLTLDPVRRQKPYPTSRPVSLHSPPAAAFDKPPMDHRSESVTFRGARRNPGVLVIHGSCRGFPLNCPGIGSTQEIFTAP
jgi:hypothetical protein